MAAATVKDRRRLSPKGAAVPRKREQKPDHRTTEGLCMLYLAQLLERKGVGVDTLASRAGIHQATLYRWLRGQGGPTLAQLDSLAKALGYESAWSLRPPASFKAK